MYSRTFSNKEEQIKLSESIRRLFLFFTLFIAFIILKFVYGKDNI
ncbi:hypothetical protein CHCC20375_4337 [Bacillus licheniformis]|nr:hypothetical protein CHCC20375_4337 [Bacillus licheniformis]